MSKIAQMNVAPELVAEVPAETIKKRDYKHTTIRFRSPEYTRLRKLGLDREISIQQMTIEALNLWLEAGGHKLRLTP